MKITIDIPNPPSEQRIINIPIHYCGGQVVDAGGYGFEERKTGKWKMGNCSVCGNHALYWAMSSGYYSSPYCPYCGAKMEVNE